MRSCVNIVSAVFVIAVTAVESAEIMSESCTDERCLVGASSWQESMANAMLQVHQRPTRNRTVEEDPEIMKQRRLDAEAFTLAKKKKKKNRKRKEAAQV